MTDHEAEERDGDRQDFLDHLDFVRDGLTSEAQSLVDLPSSCDQELFKALVARDKRWKRLLLAAKSTTTVTPKSADD